MDNIILAFIGNPTHPDSHFTCSGHGYDAFVCTDNIAVIEMLQSKCLWGAATKTYFVGCDFYRYYELSCQSKEFFNSSEEFRKLCEDNGVTVTIIEQSKELHDKFYSKAQRHW